MRIESLLARCATATRAKSSRQWLGIIAVSIVAAATIVAGGHTNHEQGQECALCKVRNQPLDHSFSSSSIQIVWSGETIDRPAASRLLVNDRYSSPNRAPPTC